MTIQVLVATMNQTDYSLLKKMNIQTDAIVCNQCDRYGYSEFDYNGHNIKWFDFAERGVGLNRNNSLMRATADVCVLADDDMVFDTGYGEEVEKAFKNNKKADVIIFNIKEEIQKKYVNKKICKINKRNFGKYGAVRVAFRREPVILNGISFNLMFGGGAKYGSGEDTLFLNDCLKSGLKIYAVPVSIAFLNDDRPSSWFKGVNDKLLFDRGVLYSLLSKKNCHLMSFLHCLKNRNFYKEYGWKKAYKMMKKGIKSVK